MCWNKRLVFVHFHLTASASSSSSPPPLLEPFVSACVFTITLFTENLWPQMASASATVSFLHRMPFFFHAHLILLGGLSSDFFFFHRLWRWRTASTSGAGPPCLCAVQMYFSSFVCSIGIVPSVFYCKGGKNKSLRSPLERNQGNEI